MSWGCHLASCLIQSVDRYSYIEFPRDIDAGLNCFKLTLTEDHSINWNDTKILQRVSYAMKLVMKEALCIQAKPPNACFDRDNGYELPECWMICSQQKIQGVSLFGGMEWWNGTLEWNSGILEQWNDHAHR